jgi:benzoate/toluate 1,2-dioxygenase alpha subunit
VLTEPTRRVPESDVDQLVMDTEDNFRVRGRVYSDREIFEAEMQKIFATTWVFVAHESEVPNTGDYKTSFIGLQPVIVSRSEDGEVYVMLNRCRHRGAVVCRERTGNANYFRCPYHGWVYGNDGKLTGIAQRRGGYTEDFEKPEGLVRVPRVDNYRGLIFASLSPEGPGLLEHLGEARVWIDRQFDRSPVGEIELRYEPHVSEYQGNWKFQVENTTDGYHGDFVHESFWMIQEKFGAKSGRHGAYVQSSVKDIKKMRKQGRTMGFDQGHGLWNTPLDPAALDQMLEGEHGEYYRGLVEKYGREEVVTMLSNMNVMVFPNVGILHGQIRVVRPIAVDRTEVSIYPFALKGVPEEINEERLRGYERFFGPSSFGSPDDVEIFALNQQGLQANQIDDWLILERGLRREKVTETGARVSHVTDETPQRALHRRWKQIMSQ